MGNTHVFYHRLPALSSAFLASIAYSFVLVAGTTCDFIQVHATSGSFLEYTTQDGVMVDMYGTTIGLLCETPPLFMRSVDQLWSMSLYFWIASSITGTFAVALSWALTIFLGPTDLNWKVLSFLSGVSAILQSPIYLMFVSKACQENVCEMSTGCIMLTISTIFWVTITIMTQCQDPPMWANELNAWRVQKQRQEGLVHPPRESKWRRWIKRRGWATSLGLAPTDSDSVNEVSRMELLENGSYYADSNNSRLMLKVMPNGKRPDDDHKSVSTFYDLEDMVRYADEERSNLFLASLATNVAINESDVTPLLEDESSAEEPRELMMFTSPVSNEDTAKNLDEKALLSTEDESPSISCMHPPRQIMITGIRSLASRLRRESKEPKSGYEHLNGDGNSDADDEDEADDCRELYFSPLSPEQLDILSQQEIPMPMDAASSGNQDLIHDWNALHAAAYAGILLPPTASIIDDVEEQEPKFYSSDDAASEISVSSGGDCGDVEGMGEVVSGTSSVSSDSSTDGIPRRLRCSKRRRRRAFSATNSVASRTSLLDLTIEEETAGDLQEMGSSGDERIVELNLSEGYPLRGVRSAPDRLGFPSTKIDSSQIDQSGASTMVGRELECVSEDSDSHVSQILRNADDMAREGPAMDVSEESTEMTEAKPLCEYSAQATQCGSSRDTSHTT